MAVIIPFCPAQRIVGEFTVTSGTPASLPPIKSSNDEVTDCEDLVSNKTVEKHLLTASPSWLRSTNPS